MDIYENDLLNSLYHRTSKVEDLGDEAYYRGSVCELKHVTDMVELCSLRDEFYKMEQEAYDLRSVLKDRIREVIGLLGVSQGDPEMLSEINSMIIRVDTVLYKIQFAVRKVGDRMIELYEDAKAELNTAEEEIARLNEYASAFYEMGGNPPTSEEEE